MLSAFKAFLSERAVAFRAYAGAKQPFVITFVVGFVLGVLVG